jgi:hypothetical protein|tara:strand:- start:2787 stop:2996 length:210 start_codon:yes stop_codon:yes gene_type:complete
MLEQKLHNVAGKTERMVFSDLDFATTKFTFWDTKDKTGFTFTAYHETDEVIELVFRKRTDEEKEAEKDA